ncbi:MAG: hypothetical protein U9M97_01550 [Candidatus Hadarchaeota archaeon]|nr:hypothetical protein [Candidatus Hadarchaeota archaeon]
MSVRLYERKKDAEFAAARVNKVTKETVKVQKIRVIGERAARNVGIRVCPDLGIASHSPKQGEAGWIVMHGDLRQAREEYKSALEFLRE